jgi:hypothetical protein
LVLFLNQARLQLADGEPGRIIVGARLIVAGLHSSNGFFAHVRFNETTGFDEGRLIKLLSRKGAIWSAILMLVAMLLLAMGVSVWVGQAGVSLWFLSAASLAVSFVVGLYGLLLGLVSLMMWGSATILQQAVNASRDEIT